MAITEVEAHNVSVLAGQGELTELRAAARRLAVRENIALDDVLIACKDDFHQTSAHIASKAGQARK